MLRRLQCAALIGDAAAIANTSPVDPGQGRRNGARHDAGSDSELGATNMDIKDILVPLFGDPEDEVLIGIVEALPQLAGAHVAATLVAGVPDPIFVGDGLVGGMAAAEFLTTLQAEAKATQARLLAHLRRTDLAFEQRLALGQVQSVCDQLTMQARHADLTVMTRPAAHAPGMRHEIVEAVLMNSGRPVLVVPPDWSPKAGMRRLFVAWNAGREAARALGDAAPFLSDAASITVGTIDARPTYSGHGEAPGVDIATHLARHGFAVDLKNLDSLGADKGASIVAAAQSVGADLIILGGYGHSRMRQAIFGGVTRTLVETSPVPLLLSH